METTITDMMKRNRTTFHLPTGTGIPVYAHSGRFILYTAPYEITVVAAVKIHPDLLEMAKQIVQKIGSTCLAYGDNEQKNVQLVVDELVYRVREGAVDWAPTKEQLDRLVPWYPLLRFQCVQDFFELLLINMYDMEESDADAEDSSPPNDDCLWTEDDCDDYGDDYDVKEHGYKYNDEGDKEVARERASYMKAREVKAKP